MNQSFSSSWKISSACIPKYLAIFRATMVNGKVVKVALTTDVLGDAD